MTTPNQDPALYERVEWTRKPAGWDDVRTWVALDDLPSGLRTFTAEELGIGYRTLGDFARDPGAQYFLVQAGARLFLVRPEGYRYARYVAAVVT